MWRMIAVPSHDVVAGRPAPRARARRRAAAGGPAARRRPRDRGPTRCGSASRRLNLDAASFRQLAEKHAAATATPCAPRSWRSSPTRGKMQNPVTGSRRHARRHRRRGRAATRRSGCRPGDRVATLVSLSLTPLRSPTAWPAGTAGPSRCRPRARAILFGRSIAACCPDDLRAELAMLSWTSAAPRP